MREWLARLRDWFRRDQLDRELAEELWFHRERLERDAATDGADAKEAHYAAGRRLGNMTGIQEAARGRWSWPWLDHFLQDVRYALRGLRRSPGFSWKVGAAMFVAFGVLALLVAAVGLYGVISYNVAQRMHELGVRVALGAQSRDVVRLVVGQGVRFAGAGVLVGLGLALLAARWIQPLLFQQSARDPATYGAVGGLLLVVALVASSVPALRATRADPNSALRSD